MFKSFTILVVLRVGQFLIDVLFFSFCDLYDAAFRDETHWWVLGHALKALTFFPFRNAWGNHSALLCNAVTQERSGWWQSWGQTNTKTIQTLTLAPQLIFQQSPFIRLARLLQAVQHVLSALLFLTGWIFLSTSGFSLFISIPQLFCV